MPMTSWKSEAMSEHRYTPAHPRAPEEIERLKACPAILMAAERRGISRVVHFTTIRGCGWHSGCKGGQEQGTGEARRIPRARLPSKCAIRKDPDWLDYVNLSIERINDWMFQKSVRWHVAGNNPWVLLSFSTKILAYPGVVFTTTNNIYPACKRSEGLTGFCRIFAETIEGRYGQQHDRTNKPAAWPTDRQAEVLYPGELCLSHLLRIDVQQEQSLDTLNGALPEFDMEVPICHSPEIFE